MGTPGPVRSRKLSFKEITRRVARESGVGRKKVESLLYVFFKEVQSSIKSGNAVQIPTVGIFYPQILKGRKLFGGTRELKDKVVWRFKETRATFNGIKKKEVKHGKVWSRPRPRPDKDCKPESRVPRVRVPFE